MYRGTTSRRSKIESTQRIRYHLDRLRLGAQPNPSVSAAELRMRLRFNRLMRGNKSKMGDRNHPSSPSQKNKNKIEDDWIDWMLIWKTATSMKQNRADVVEEHMEIDKRALVLLKQAFLRRSELERPRKRNEFLLPQDAAIRIQMNFRAYLRKKSKLLQELRDLAIANTKLKKIRCSFKDSSYRNRLALDPEENQRFAEIIIVLLLTVDAIEGANAKIRVAKKLMTDEIEKLLDKVDNKGRQSQKSVASIEDFSPVSSNNKDKGEKSTSEPAKIRMEGISDAGAVLLRQAFARGLKNERSNWLSPIDAAIKIQRSFRAYLVRRSQALQAYRELALVKTKLGEIRFLFYDFSYRRRVARDAEERQRFAEKIIVLLLNADAIEGNNVMIRSFKKSMLDELEAMLDVIDNKGNSEKKFIASMKPMLEEKDEETTDHGSVLLRRASLRRVGEKEKWNELSPVVAAIKIQRSFRDYLKRKSQALQAYRELAVVGTKLKEIKGLFNDFSYRRRVSRDAEERQKFAEKIIVLLLTADAIVGVNVMIRGSKNCMVNELEAMLDVVDPQPPDNRS